MSRRDPNPDGVVVAPKGATCPVCGDDGHGRLAVYNVPTVRGACVHCAELYFGTTVIVPRATRAEALRQRARGYDAVVATANLAKRYG